MQNHAYYDTIRNTKENFIITWFITNFSWPYVLIVSYNLVHYKITQYKIQWLKMN